MRTTITVFVCVAAIGAVVVAQTTSLTPDALLQGGIASFRASRYTEAAKDLKEAADAMLSSEQMQAYVNSGKFANIDKFETALVYLALAEAKLGHDDQAREAVLRLDTAERIENVFARLPLDADGAAFQQLAARLVPNGKLPENTQVAAAAPPAQTAAPAPAPAPPPAAADRAERDKAIADAVAAERARMEQEADERIAAATRTLTPRTDYLVRLRQADAYADNGQTSRADEIYMGIANASDAPRDIVAESGVGLYRISAFRDALRVFRKLAPFARGEEDLRYYNAIALYETGDIANAKRELACSLPFIETNEDVARYRAKIEKTRAVR
ncbi:MAG TPA: hypothetical protein VLU46_07240 [Thermoanaerobaculia bacterium]|nr:hypothetical protein [Thermoanaerobaculia bacterium]